MLPSLAEASYPDPQSFPASELDQLLDLPDGQRMDAAWFRTHVWPQTRDFRIPADGVMRGRQAVIFPILLSSSSTPSGREMRLMAKRVVPRELPPKSSPQMWMDFAQSAQREIAFYRDLMEKRNERVRDLFPVCYYSDSNNVPADE